MELHSTPQLFFIPLQLRVSPSYFRPPPPPQLVPVSIGRFTLCVMMSISKWDREHFWIYLLNHNSFTYQTWSIDRYKQGQYSSEIIWIVSMTRSKFQAPFGLATCSNYLLTNHIKFPVFHFFKRVNKGELKMVNINH